MTLRIWHSEEFLGRDPDDVVKQSDDLSEALRRLLSGKHPGAQFLSLLEMTATWVTNHQPKENRKHALEMFHQGLDECVEQIEKTFNE